MTMVSVNNESNVATQVGNPLLGQIRDFIESDEPSPVDPLGIIVRTIRGRIGRIGWVAVTAALLLAILAWLAISPIYQSAGVLRILPREAKLLYADADDSRLRLYDAFTNAEVHLMQSRPVMETAWGTLHDEFHGSEGQVFTMPKNAAELARLISINNRKGLVTVAADSGDAALSAAAVNVVLGAYQAHKEQARDRVNEVRRKELQERERQLASTLAGLDARYLEIGGEHDLTSLSKAHIAKTAQLEVLEERIGELNNTIAQFQRTGAVGADDIRNSEIQRALLLDQALAEMTYERASRLAELSTLRNRYRPTHNRIVSAELELKTLEAAISERRDQITTLGNVGALTGGTSQSSQQSLDELEQVRQKLLERRILLNSEAGELIGKLVKMRRVVAEQKRVVALLDATKRALDEVIVESQAGLSRTIEIIAHGKVPDRPIEDKRKPIAFGAAFFGGLATFVGFIFLSIFNPRVRYSDDLPQAILDKVAVVVPAKQKQGADLARAGFKLRNEIDMRRSNANEPIVVAVSGTACNPGSSLTAAALCNAFSARNASVLLVDANNQSRITGDFSLEDKPGLHDVMGAGLSIADAMNSVTTGSSRIDVLAAGVCPEDSTGRDCVTNYTIQDFRNLVGAATASHEVVVLDLGELAPGRHSSLAAAVSDQLVLVTSAGQRKRDISDSKMLLDRVIPDRYLLVFDKASPLDPMLEQVRGDESRDSWQIPLLSPLKKFLEFK
jgi:uncharacterized protein involved in exopolysaccharide biosynthesis/Mrp family chromosome partitioning ATPase